MSAEHQNKDFRETGVTEVSTLIFNKSVDIPDTVRHIMKKPRTGWHLRLTRVTPNEPCRLFITETYGVVAAHVSTDNFADKAH